MQKKRGRERREYNAYTKGSLQVMHHGVWNINHASSSFRSPCRVYPFTFDLGGAELHVATLSRKDESERDVEKREVRVYWKSIEYSEKIKLFDYCTSGLFVYKRY